MSEPILNKAVRDLLISETQLAPRRRRSHITLDHEVQDELRKVESGPPDTLEKAMSRALNGMGDVERLAFEADPTSNRYHTIYKTKYRLIPDKMLKRILIQDDLVAAIVQVRQNQMSAFGRPRPDRFATGFVIEMTQETIEAIEALPADQKTAAKDDIQRRIARVTKKMVTCGEENLDLSGNQDRLTFPQYISMSVRNAIGVGRIATEILRRDGADGKKQFVGFRVIDAGTIYRAEPQREAAEAVRRSARQLLSQIKNERLLPEKFEKDEYAWVQVIDDRPVQAFTAEECLVHNFYAVPDVELDGYPVTPLDTVISAVTTHINITTHNKIYFQSGRAARGMLVLKSDEVDQKVVARVRQQFNAQINSVNNAWRMPVFGIGTEDEITWQPIDSAGGGRDMEFQYLADMNARVILSAFQMSPEEIPGYSYLSRGTNNQALSESNNEYRLEAARDVGIRPLLAHFEDFLNQSVLPLFDESLARRVTLKLVGLNAETAEKESVRLQQDMPVHMTYDEVLEKVEKRAIGKRLGGEYPLNPQFQAILDKFIPVGVQLEELFGIAGASKDPQYTYLRDPFWFQWQQFQMQAQQMQQQAQQAAAGGPPPGGDGGGGGGGGGDESPPGEENPSGDAAKPSQESSQTENQKSATADEASASGSDLSRSIDQALGAIGALSKGEKALPPSKRKLLVKQKMLVQDFLKGWEADADEANREILAIADKLKPRS